MPTTHAVGWNEKILMMLHTSTITAAMIAQPDTSQGRLPLSGWFALGASIEVTPNPLPMGDQQK